MRGSREVLLLTFMGEGVDWVSFDPLLPEASSSSSSMAGLFCVRSWPVGVPLWVASFFDGIMLGRRLSQFVLDGFRPVFLKMSPPFLSFFLYISYVSCYEIPIGRQMTSRQGALTRIMASLCVMTKQPRSQATHDCQRRSDCTEFDTDLSGFNFLIASLRVSIPLWSLSMICFKSFLILWNEVTDNIYVCMYGHL